MNEPAENHNGHRTITLIYKYEAAGWSLYYSEADPYISNQIKLRALLAQDYADLLFEINKTPTLFQLAYLTEYLPNLHIQAIELALSEKGFGGGSTYTRGDEKKLTVTFNAKETPAPKIEKK